MWSRTNCRLERRPNCPLQKVEVLQALGRRQSAAPNQANDHGEIIVSGNSDVDIDAERLNSYRGQFRAYQRRTGPSHGLSAPMTMAEDIAAEPAASRAGRYFR